MSNFRKLWCNQINMQDTLLQEKYFTSKFLGTQMAPIRKNAPYTVMVNYSNEVICTSLLPPPEDNCIGCMFEVDI